MTPVSQKPAAAPRQPSDSKPSGVVAATVESCRRRLAFQDLLARLIGLTAAAVLFPLLVVIVDHLWPNGLPHRIVSGAAVGWVVVVVLTLLFLVVQAARRRINPLFAAQQVERARGIRHNTLVNALLLSKEPRLAYAAEAAQRQAASDVESHFIDVLETRTASRTPSLALGLTLVVWALYVTVSPKSTWTSLGRFFGADLIAPTATRIEMTLPRRGDIVHAGEPLAIEVEITGRRVDAAWFDVLAAPGSKLERVARYPLRAAANAAATGRWRLTLAPHEVAGRIRFRCLAGDATLDGIIDALPQPTLSDLTVHVAPPAHTGLPSGNAPERNLRVEAGSRATFSVRANVEIHNPVFVLRGESETRTRMAIDRASPSSATLALVLSDRGEYWIEFSDRWGYSNRNPTRYRIDVRPDGVPRVAIVLPARRDAPDDRIDITQFEQLVARAEDDFHVSELVVVSDADGLIERSVVPSPVATNGQTTRREARVATNDLVPSAGTRVRVWFEARDNRVLPDGTPAPQMARSRVLTLFKPKESSKRARSRSAASSEGGDQVQSRESSSGDADSAQPGDEAGTAAPLPESNASDDSRPDSSDPGSDGKPSDPSGADDSEALGNQEESGVGGADPNAGDESASAGGGEGLEAAVERFLEEHREDVREIRRRLEEREGRSATDGPGPGEDEPSESPAEAGDESERSSDDGARKEPSDSNPDGDERSPPRGGARRDDAPDSERPGDSGAEDSKNERPTDDARPGESTPKNGNDKPESAAENEIPESKGETRAEEPNTGSDPRDSGGESGEKGATEKERSPSSSKPAKSETKPGPDNDTTESPNEQPESTRDGAASGESRSPDEQGSEAPPGKDADRDAGQEGPSGQTKESTKRETRPGGKEPGESGEHPETPVEKDNGESADPPRPDAEKSGQESPRGGEDSDEGTARESGSEPRSDGKSPGAGSQKQEPANGATPPAGRASDRKGQLPSDGAGENPGAGARSAGGGEARIARRPDDDPAPDEPVVEEEPSANDSDSNPLESQGRRDVLDVLGLLERAELDLDGLLDELDWDAEKVENFVRALERLRVLAARRGALRAPRMRRHDAALGESGIQTGREMSSDASMGARKAGAGDDTLGRIAPPAEQRISPALRHVLDAYYRSLAARQKSSKSGQPRP